MEPPYASVIPNHMRRLYRDRTRADFNDGFAQLLCATGNNVLNPDPATFSIKAQLDNDPPDNDYNHFANSIFANNILFP